MQLPGLDSVSIAAHSLWGRSVDLVMGVLSSIARLASRLDRGAPVVVPRSSNFSRRTEAARSHVASPQRSNWYEGGMPFQGPDRSYIPAIVQDARLDQNFVTRRELLRKGRYFSQNNPVIKRILEVDQTYTIGANGAHSAPASGDVEWNKSAKEVFAEMCESAGLEGESLPTMMHIGHQCERTDGEIFYLKTWRAPTARERSLRKGPIGKLPCLQMIEAHRIETPFNRWNEDTDSVIDGVAVQKLAMPDGRVTRVKTGFWVRNSFGMFDTDSSWALYPLEGVIHVGEAQRAGQIRYISPFYSIMNVVNDFDDLQQAEMKAAKDGAEKSTFIKTPSGELNPEDIIKAGFHGRNSGQQTQGVEAEKEFKKKIEFYQRMIGGRTTALRHGDEVQQFLNSRPTVTSREYWYFLISVICAGLGVSCILVFPDFSDNGQGTAIRAELGIAGQLFIKRGMKWRQMVSDVWEYFMGWAINNDPRVANPPPDWRKIAVYSPRAVDVDVGHNSQAMLAELAGGATNWGRIYGPLGLDWKEEFNKLNEQITYANSIGLKVGFTQRGQIVIGDPADEQEIGGLEPNATPQSTVKKKDAVPA